MMNVLLKHLSRMALTLATCEAFLLRAAMLTVVGVLTTDDWVYLAHLVVYRATTRLNASDREKAMMAKRMRQIEEEKNELGSMFN